MKKLFLLTCISFFCYASTAQIITAFSPLKTVTQKGDITFASNAITQCTGVGAACTNGRAEIPSAGTTHNQTTGITIGYIDIDGSTGIGAQTFSSSNANLDMGGVLGCGIIYAYLSWEAFVSTGTTNYSKRDSIYLQVPGSAVYNKLKADNFVDNTSPYANTYHCYKDVTNLVKAAGPGIYTAANIVAATGGTNQFGGWSLVVLYSDPLKPLRNLTIFKGLAGVSTATGAVQFGISGFFTPPSPAPVNVRLGVIALDGDRALSGTGGTGDSLKFNGIAVSNGKNPLNDIFNSTITNNNTEITRNPSFTNTLGYDADIIDLANGTKTFLGNSASNATIRLSTGNETYLVDIVTTVIDVFEPQMAFEKTFVNLNANTPAQLGDVIEFTLKVRNQGSDPADSLVVIDSLYGALNYVPNSFQIVSGPNAGTKTDAIGDDQMDFTATGNFITARLGLLASGTKGGKLNHFGPDSVTVFKFQAKITNDCTIFRCMDSIYNVAGAVYYGQTAIQKRSTFSSPNNIDPATGCPTTGPTGLKVTVPLCAVPADTSVTNCTPYNLSLLIPKRPGYTSFINSVGTTVTQATATGTYFAVRTIYPSSNANRLCTDTVQINFTANGSTCVLPIKLLAFDVTYTKPSIQINWSTVQEINNNHFELERSVDGITFEKIATIMGSNFSSTQKNYGFTDVSFPKINKIYYRLIQVDNDGTAAFSTIKIVLLKEYKTQTFSVDNIAPNPTTNFTTVSISSFSNKKISISITNAVGKTIKQQNAMLRLGKNNITLDFNNQAAGLYFVNINDEVTGTNAVHKILIIK